MKFHECNNFLFNTLCSCSHIDKVLDYNYLGITISANLKWKAHTEHIVNKLRAISAMMFKLKNIVSRLSYNEIFFAWVFPHILYGLQVWGGTYQNSIHDVNYLYNSFRHDILINTSSHKSISLTKFNVRQLYVYKVLIFMFRNPDWYTRVNTPRNNMRSHCPYRIPLPRKTIFKKSLCFLAPRICREFSEIITQQQSLSTFKKAIKERILEINDIERFISFDG